MRDLAGSLLEEKDLTAINSTEMEEVAGALSGLKPNQLKKLPKKAVLESFTTINKNKNMSPQQVRFCCQFFLYGIMYTSFFRKK